MKKLYKTKRKGTFLEPLQKPLAGHQTKICSIGDVCEGKPLPNNRSHFYANCSACIACTAKKSKEKWAEKKSAQDNYGY